MKLEESCYQPNIRNSFNPALNVSLPDQFLTLLGEVQSATNRGLRVFPVPPIAKLTANPDLLIAEATTEIPRLAELVAELGMRCDWRAIVDRSLCVVRIGGPTGRSSVAALSQDDQEQCLTLRIHRGDSTWAVFRRPMGLARRASGRKLPPGVSILTEGESFPIPPSNCCSWSNPCAEIEAAPFWLRELAFESPESPSGNMVTVPALSPRPSPCRSISRFQKPQRSIGKGYPTCDQAGWRAGFRVSRRR